MCLAIPGELVASYDREGVRYGRVRFGAITRDVCLHAFPDAVTGEFLLVHVGFAIARIDRAEAERTLLLLDELNELEQAESVRADEAEPGWT
jgi:hydrogenase expression/formation protein HypC